MNNLGSMRIVDESDCLAGDISEQTRNMLDDWNDLS